VGSKETLQVHKEVEGQSGRREREREGERERGGERDRERGR